LMGLLPCSLAVQFLFNGLKGKQGLLGRESS
jgi:small neutral amino acid transporter SnatA (MarC family)